MTRRLYHVTVTLPCRDEYPGARGEKRTYTPRTRQKLAARLAWLAARYPGCPVKVTTPGPLNRTPIF